MSRPIVTFTLLLSLAVTALTAQVSAHPGVDRALDHTTATGQLSHAPSPSQPGPGLVLTHIPAWGSWGDPLQGQALNVNPANYQVTLVILIEGLGWYSKSYCDPSLTVAYPVPLDANGRWSASITTGGVDQTAIRIAAYLIPKTYTPPCTISGGGLPATVAANAVASSIADRQNPNVRTINFSGQTWWVKTNTVPLGPGPNYFSDSAENVWVDSQGYLHLKITNRNGTWYCPEIISQKVLGFGANMWVLGSPVDGLDPNVVLGMFTWSDNYASYYNREIDIEFSKFGNRIDTNNAQYTVQPYWLSQNFHRFQMPPGVPVSSHVLMWLPNSTSFKSARGTQLTNLISQWTYTGASFPSGDQNIRMNLWLLNGQPPTDGAEVEVVVRAYTFLPAKAN
jgi:hypothetical protein